MEGTSHKRNWFKLGFDERAANSFHSVLNSFVHSFLFHYFDQNLLIYGERLLLVVNSSVSLTFESNVFEYDVFAC